jgi:hypothetical protein
MPVRRARKPSEDEVLSRWTALGLEQRKAVMSFDDIVLVGRIRSALQALFEKHSVMQQLCVNLGCEDTGSVDPFEASVLLKHAFEFTWGIARMADNPSIVMMSAAASPIMVMKVGFLQETQRLVGNMKNVLPDFLTQQATRMPMPKARWKDLWGVEPSSMIALEQQLAKLAEQALWAMVSDQSLAAQSIEEDTGTSDLSLELWMTEHDREVSRAREAASRAGKKKKKRQRPQPTLPSASAEMSGDDIEPETQFEAVSSLHSDAEGGDIVVHGSYASLPPYLTSKSEDVSTPVSSTREDGTTFTEESIDQDPEPVVEPCSSACGLLDLRPPSTPPSSACGSRHWNPPQLVTYIWDHTSQMTSPRNHNEETPESSTCVSGAVTRTPASRDSDAHGTPWHRGQWVLSKQAPVIDGKPRAFVRNTFIDIDDPGDDRKLRSSRPSRSLSPGFSPAVSRQPPEPPPCADQWQWYWH